MAKKTQKPTVLVILDGWGVSPKEVNNAVFQADTPCFDALMDEFPHTTLAASGLAVGLPEGSIGNSEVGHLTMGAGRIIPQPALLVSEAIECGDFFKKTELIQNLKKLAQSGGNLHLMGLLSDAYVHSHINHLFAFMQAAKQHGIKNVYIHAFLDGRDAPPKSAATYLQALDEKIKELDIGTIASIHGRFYAMDRDNNWERTQKSFNVLTTKQQNKAANWQAIIEQNYNDGITDEFIPPTQLDPRGIIFDDDGIIFFNFRPDRARQLTATFIDSQFGHFRVFQPELAFFMTPVSYAPELKLVTLFAKHSIPNTLTNVLHAHDKRVFAIAETEKYAHITYFFNGGREKPYPTEAWTLIKSIPAKNYVDKPKMSAENITAAVLESLQNDPHDFYVINYANADMVGHSGNMRATVKALEFLDTQLKILHNQVIQTMDGLLLVTSDHGNAEQMFNEDTDQPDTAHTTNPVPFIFVRNDMRGHPFELPLTQLADIAPFILETMKLAAPPEMA